MRIIRLGVRIPCSADGCIGVLLGGVAENGRAPVKLVASGVHAGTKLMVKPVNMRVVA